MATYPIGAPYSGATPTPPYGDRSATDANFIPQIWSGKLVEKFYAATVLAAISNTDYEGEIKNMGDEVFIRTRPTISLANYSTDIDLTVQRPSGIQAPSLKINKGKYFNLALDDVMEIQSDLDLMSMWAEDAAEQMKLAVDDNVLTELTGSAGAGTAGLNLAAADKNYGNAAGFISGNLRLGITTAPAFVAASGLSTGVGDLVTTSRSVINWLIDMGQALDENNIPETGRWVVIPAWVAALIKRSDLKDASLAGDGTSILRNGRLGMIDRFTLYMSNRLPVGTGGLAAGETATYFGTTAALTFASQFTKMETLRSERSFSNLLRGLQVYGFQVVNSKAIGRSIIKPGN